MNTAAAVTLAGRLNCEHSRCCYSCRQALGFSAVIATCFYAIFQLRKSDCSESSESERFSILVTRAENCGQKTDDCGGANKWEWVLINGSWTGLVSQRHKNLVGHSKLFVGVG